LHFVNFGAYYLLNMSGVDTSELLTPAQAARLMDVSREWIRRLMRDGKLATIEIAGRPFVRHKEVMSYKPGPKTGRPPKASGSDGKVSLRSGKKSKK